MFNVVNNYNSIVSILYKNVICVFSYYYLLVLSCTLLIFLSYRVPYCYSFFLFFIVLITTIFSVFVSLFFSRAVSGLNEFFSSFIPAGTPMYICPFVCVAETISYIIRPLVLVLRPFINISLGCFGAVAICNLCFSSLLWFCVLFIVFFYEVFVAVIHWYIVTSILSFSIDH